jgi:hypothetical protein
MSDKWAGPHRYKELRPEVQKEADDWINALASGDYEEQHVLLRAMWSAVIDHRQRKEPARLLATIGRLFGPDDCLNNGYVLPRCKIFKRGRLEIRWRDKTRPYYKGGDR